MESLGVSLNHPFRHVSTRRKIKAAAPTRAPFSALPQPLTLCIPPRAQPASVVPPTTQDPSELLRSLAGEELSFVAMAPTALGRGLVTQGLVIRQAIVSVPMHNSMCLTDEPMSGISVFGDKVQQIWQQHHGKMPEVMQDFLSGEERWDIRMTGWLLYVLDTERNKCPVGLNADGSSLWGQYVALLPPEREMCCLLNYVPEEAKELQLPQLITEARVQREWSEYCHNYYFCKASGMLKFAETMEDTIWACAMVRSRTFSENVNGEGITLMVPYADLANHSFSHNSTFCVGQSRQNFELRSVVHIGPGEEAVISYGEAKCNYQLIRDYGFVVPGNPNDRIPLMPTSPPSGQSSTSTGNGKGSSSQPNGSSVNAGGDYLSNAYDSSRTPFNGHRLNGLSLAQAAGMAGDWMKGELHMQVQQGSQSQGAGHAGQHLEGQKHNSSSPSSSSSASPCGSASLMNDSGNEAAALSSGCCSCVWSNRAPGDGVFWARQRSAILSLPLTDGYRGRGGAGAAAEENTGGDGKGLLAWMTRSITDSGTPPPRGLRPEEVPMEREAIMLHIKHMKALLTSLPTTADEDRAILDRHAAAVHSKQQSLSCRHVQAIRCRLEWKLLVGQGLGLLRAYLESLR